MCAWTSAGLLHGCAEPQDDDDTACVESPLIGGVEVADARLDAIGTVGVEDEDGDYHMVCSATLIAPALALTAKHCTVTQNGAPLTSQGKVVFAVGPNADAPTSLARVISMETSSPFSGGVAQLGSDIALLHLENPVAEVEPVAVYGLPVSEGLLGRELSVYGFGRDIVRCPHADGGRAVRRVGAETLQMLRGNVFDFIYGDRASFFERAAQDAVGGDLALRYEHGVLLPGYEAWGAGSSGAPQTCYGDSGGPLLLEREGRMELLGVTSWSWRSSARECDYGTVFALIGPETAALIGKALAIK